MTEIKQQLKPSVNYLLLIINVTVTVIKLFNTQWYILFLNLNSPPVVATSCFNSLSTLLYATGLKWH